MIEDDPTTFVFSTNEYRGACSGLNRRRPMEIGGFEDQPEMTLAVNLRDIEGGLVFGQDMPSIGDRITIGGVDYRVERTEVDSMGECLQMDLRSKDK